MREDAGPQSYITYFPNQKVTDSLLCNCQIPRIDISDPANQIEYHPALVRGAGDGVIEAEEEEAEEESEEEDPDEVAARLPNSQAAKLLVLISHARSCPGHHHSRSHSEVMEI